MRLPALAEVVLAVHLDPTDVAGGDAMMSRQCGARSPIPGARRTPASQAARCARRMPASCRPYFLLATTVPPTIFSQVPFGT